MSAVLKFDPYDPLPFLGYIDADTGRQEHCHSLAHFFHAERLRGVDEHYRRYLLQLDDPELFQLEVEDIGGSTLVSRDGWDAIQENVLYAGVYMQAVANRAAYAKLINAAPDLVVKDCSFSVPLANALGKFISDLSDQASRLRVGFIGKTSDDFARNCFSVLFAKNHPQCLFAIEDDGCAFIVSQFAQSAAAAFALIESSLSEDSIAENIQRRCSHVFRFVSPGESHQIQKVSALLEAAGVTLRPLQPET
jgi:hypothetical protein